MIYTSTVSVLMPIRGCRETLPMAVASVFAQTMPDWRLIAVFDDTNPVPQWLTRINDPRIQILRNPAPGGRGAARQYGLNEARSRYLAFLDADDWMLPRRLETQIAMLEKDRQLALVSGAIFVLNRSGDLFGVRRLPSGAGVPRVAARNLVDSPVMNAASMMRTDLARAEGFRQEYSIGEDAEFLVRCLRGRKYLQDIRPVYCYREFDSFSISGFREAQAAVRRRYRRHAVSTHQRAATLTRQWAKSVVYETALQWLGADWIIGRRSRSARPEEVALFYAGHGSVMQQLNLIGEDS